MEVNDVDSTTMTKSRPAVAPATPVGCAPSASPLRVPNSSEHGTGVSVAGPSQRWIAPTATVMTYGGGFGATSLRAAFAGVRFTDLPGTPPRGAPV
jgi:hypothetical protein